MSKPKAKNKYTVSQWKMVYTLLEDGFPVEEFTSVDVATRRAKELNRVTVPGWKNQPVFVGASDEEEEEV